MQLPAVDMALPFCSVRVSATERDVGVLSLHLSRPFVHSAAAVDARCHQQLPPAQINSHPQIRVFQVCCIAPDTTVRAAARFHQSPNCPLPAWPATITATFPS
jgi:hypothetical protein